jgi:ubiquinone/menaquinone biosynthesis C-methylase UbiE
MNEFMKIMRANKDIRVVNGFGDEWTRFPQDVLSEEERRSIFNDYFKIFPWENLSKEAVGADIGCGSGRWALVVAPKVTHLHVVDASIGALRVAMKNLARQTNVSFHHASVDELPLSDQSLDFAYSLGVLHHVPDTVAALKSIARKLKPGSPFLIYLYYAFDSRPAWFRALWMLSDKIRYGISRMPMKIRYLLSQIIAFLVYWPLARLARVFEKAGMLPNTWPLAYYRDKSLYVMRTDALDRFGTRLEKRFSRDEITNMLEEAGFTDVRFSSAPPYWCAVAINAMTRLD